MRVGDLQLGWVWIYGVVEVISAFWSVDWVRDEDGGAGVVEAELAAGVG